MRWSGRCAGMFLTAFAALGVATPTSAITADEFRLRSGADAVA